MNGTTVHVVTIGTRHGDIVSVYLDRENAVQAVQDYAVGNWEDEFGDVPPNPFTWDNADDYFEHAEENYTIQTVVVQQ